MSTTLLLLAAAHVLLALLISGGSWGLVAWAVATAAYDVEADLSEAEAAEAGSGQE